MKRWRQYRRLLRNARPYRPKLILALAAAIVVAIALPTIPLFVRAIVDKAIPHHHYGFGMLYCCHMGDNNNGIWGAVSCTK